MSDKQKQTQNINNGKNISESENKNVSGGDSSPENEQNHKKNTKNQRKKQIMLIYFCIVDLLFWFTKTTGMILAINVKTTTKTILTLLVYTMEL